MGFFSQLLGRDSANAANQLGQRSMGRINDGYDSANQYARQGYDTSIGRFQPFADTANRGYNLLADSYGLNGDAARQRSFQSYSSDPFNQHSGDVTGRMMQNMQRTAASRGMGNAGATQLALSRAGIEAQDRRIADWRQGLSGYGNQAVGIAGTMAGLDQGYYGGMADRAVGRANALNGIDANSTMAANNARMAGMNNLLSGLGALGGSVFSAFAPGASGMSAAGNFGNWMSGGGIR